MTEAYVQTNTNDSSTASILAALNDTEQGTLFCAQIHKVGVQRGPISDQTTYGDDVVQVLVWAGFDYSALINRSMTMLRQQLDRGGFIERIMRATLNENSKTNIEDVCHALQEVRDNFRKVAYNTHQPLPGSPPWSSVWERLTIHGVPVRGCRIYTGVARPEDERAPVPGTIYIQGVKLGEVVINPAVNGQWKSESKPKTVAKKIIKGMLPVGLYCQYRLQPERVEGVSVGMVAAQKARDFRIPIDPATIPTLFKIA